MSETVNTSRPLPEAEVTRIQGMSPERLHAEIVERQGLLSDFCSANQGNPDNPHAGIDWESATKVEGPFKGRSAEDVKNEVLGHKVFLEAARPELKSKEEARRLNDIANAPIPEVGSYTPSGSFSPAANGQRFNNALELFAAKGDMVAGEKGDNRPKATIEDMFQAAKNRESRVFEFRDVSLADMHNVSMTGTGGFPVDQPWNRPGVITPYDRPRGIVPMLPVVQCPSNTDTLTYLDEGTLTNKVAVTKEGESAPVQALTATFERKTVEKITVLLPYTEELMADVPAWSGYVYPRLRRLFDQYVEDEAITADGTDVARATGVPAGKHWSGLTNVTGIKKLGFSATDPDELQGTTQDLDFFVKGLELLWGENTEPDFFAFGYAMKARLLTAKDKDGRYLLGDPKSGDLNSVWGIPTSISPHIPDDSDSKPSVIALKTQDFGILQKGGIMVQTGYNDDDFARGQMTIRMSMRGNVLAFRPQSLVQIKFAATAPAYS